MNTAYIFDVDGTLTPSRGIISQDMLNFMQHFATNHDVYLVSGSDYDKTIEQLGQNFVEDFVKISYNCSGNSVWKQGTEIYRSQWQLPEQANNWLKDQLTKNKYPEKTGNHIEHRTGSVNFSILGRNANHGQRAKYVEHDKNTQERIHIAQEFNRCFEKDLNIKATVGGETGIDITEKNMDKRQVARQLNGKLQPWIVGRPVHFFGDRCEYGGNDWPIAMCIQGHTQGTVHHVKNWQNTLDILKSLTNSN